MKALLVTMTLVAVMMTGCNTPEPDALTEDQKLEIIQELESIQTKISEAIQKKDFDAIFANFAADNFLRFIDNGIIEEDYNNWVSTYKNNLSGLNTISFVSSDMKTTVLSSTTALQTFNFSEELTTIDGVTMRFKGAVTTVYQKKDEIWLIVHLNQSYYPVED
ncbi:MAG: nuclear transport factor 2 family protein [Bacteroidales bacterium]